MLLGGLTGTSTYTVPGGSKVSGRLQAAARMMNWLNDSRMNSGDESALSVKVAVLHFEQESMVQFLPMQQ